MIHTRYNEALCHFANVDIDGSPEERRDAAARLAEMRELVRAEARARVIARMAIEQAADPYNTDGARRVPPRRVTRLFTPHGTLTHAITGRAVRPATARERASFELARMRGERSLLIQHMNDGVICEEPYIVTDTKTLEMVDFER